MPTRPFRTSIATLSQEVPTQLGLGPRAQDHYRYDRENDRIHRIKNTGHDHHGLRSKKRHTLIRPCTQLHTQHGSETTQTSSTIPVPEVPTQIGICPRAQSRHSYDCKNDSIHRHENSGHDRHNSCRETRRSSSALVSLYNSSMATRLVPKTSTTLTQEAITQIGMAP